jgi:hypothetical protein
VLRRVRPFRRATLVSGLTAVVWPSLKAYFFLGQQYLRYDIPGDGVDEGFPKRIGDAWPGVFPSGIDAAVVWPNDKAYFFRGGEYVRYDIAKDATDPGYPVWLYHQFCLSFRDVEDLLAERGIIVSYETIRQWCQKFGAEYARTLKR